MTKLFSAAILVLALCLIGEGQAGAEPAKVAIKAPTAVISVSQWFNTFDQIMSANIIKPQEKEQCDGLLGQALSPTFDKTYARNLLTGLSTRYDKATHQLNQMPRLGQTQQLFEGYAWYYAETAKLFRNYLKLIDSPLGMMALDENGQLIAPKLLQKKEQLVQVRQALLALDQKLRGQFGVAGQAI